MPPVFETRVREQSARFPELDGLRGLAILAVLCFHLRLPGDTGLAVVDAYNHVANLGWSGVDLFFVLSGFLITGILLRTRGTEGYLRNFYARRVLRIFPLYYVMIAVMFFGIRLFPIMEEFRYFWISGEQNWWFYPLFLANISEGLGYTRHASFVVAWSLCVEEQFYLVWPLLVLRWQPKTLFRITVATLAVSWLVRWWLIVPFGGSRMLVPWLAPCRLDGLAAGALVAIVLHGDSALVPRLHLWARRSILPLLAGCGYIMYRQIVQPPEDSSLGQDIGAMTWGYTWMALLYGAILVLGLFESEQSALPKLLRWAPLVEAGKYSYAIYLIHYPVYAFVTKYVASRKLFPELGGLATQSLLIVFTLAVTWALAMVSWRFLEKPCLGLRRYFEYAPPLPRLAPVRSAD